MSVDHAIPELDAQGLRRFGFTTGGIVAVLFGLLFPLLSAGDWPLWPWIVLALLAVPALFTPTALRPLHRGWMKLGLLASRITTPLILGTVFFAIIFPLGVIKGALGQNDMRRPFMKTAKSYRVPSRRNPPANLEKPF